MNCEVTTNKLSLGVLRGKVNPSPILILFLFFILNISRSVLAQEYDYCKQASSMVTTIQSFHYQPKNLNNDFSEKVFDDFFELLDPNGRFFTQEDLSSLSGFRKKLDEEIEKKSCRFLVHAIELYRKKLLLADSMISKIMKKPLEFSKEDVIEFNMHGRDKTYAKDHEALERRWNYWLKYQILAFMFSTDDEENSVSNAPAEDLMLSEPEIREKILGREKCRIDKILNHPMGFDEYVASHWLKAIALTFDPHTDFFSSYDIRTFEASISKDAYSYGIHIEENRNGDIVISSIVPGSPAWNANELNKGDIILRLETSDQKSHDFMCMDIFEAYESLQSTDEREIKLVIKKNNGQVRAVNLKKEKMEMEENVVQSFLLKGEKKIGFISLPGFYTQLEDDDAIGCANDVAKEIIKMKKENIEGLILDLRFNGGGSMKEALELVGLFIDYGPVTISVNKDNNPVVMRDMNRGTVYSGPLVVMVNSMSASASEIFSAALQDYNRAVIVGETTYGKASGQIILPLEGVNAVPGKMSGEFVKITVEKFFRLNGQTYQRVGVVPDIVLPDYYGQLPIREKYAENSLSSDSISKKTYVQTLNPLPLKKLSERSKSRISTHKSYSEVLALSDTDFRQLRFRLYPELFQQDFQAYDQWFNKLEESTTQQSTNFMVEHVGYNVDYIEGNSLKSEYTKMLAQDIHNSIYVDEAYRIIKDLIELLK